MEYNIYSMSPLNLKGEDRSLPKGGKLHLVSNQDLTGGLTTTSNNSL